MKSIYGLSPIVTGHDLKMETEPGFTFLYEVNIRFMVHNLYHLIEVLRMSVSSSESANIRTNVSFFCRWETSWDSKTKCS